MEVIVGEIEEVSLVKFGVAVEHIAGSWTNPLVLIPKKFEKLDLLLFVGYRSF